MKKDDDFKNEIKIESIFSSAVAAVAILGPVISGNYEFEQKAVILGLSIGSVGLLVLGAKLRTKNSKKQPLEKPID